jgi:hypothetical protein
MPTQQSQRPRIFHQRAIAVRIHRPSNHHT